MIKESPTVGRNYNTSNNNNEGIPNKQTRANLASPTFTWCCRVRVRVSAPINQHTMEPAKIDWKTVESVFVEDSLYEHIEAPKWVDFSAPPDHDKTQDEAWFCRPDCNHPKTAQDFYKSSPPSAKLLSTVGISDMLRLRDRNARDANLKRRPAVAADDSRPDENTDPNRSTPPPASHAKSLKDTFKSSVDPKPKELKTARSAKNLLGRDIFSHITEFCNELKKLAVRAKEKEDEESGKNGPTSDTNSLIKPQDDRLEADEVVRMPLLGISEDNLGSGTSNGKKSRRKKRNDEVENTPLSMDLNSIRNQESQKIRTNPPTPQCFSAVRGQAGARTPVGASKSKLMVWRWCSTYTRN
uniref:Uncharacterized protein n=1 Tax=Kalanchoe fedtschenkoi TaxID=63787 RepID=A0A7N0ZRS3_KALFE